MLEFGTMKPATLCGQLLNRLQRRELHKQIYSKRLQDFDDPEVRAKLLAISKPENDVLRGRIEEAIGEVLTKHLKLEVD
jgi:hypothetical protein